MLSVPRAQVWRAKILKAMRLSKKKANQKVMPPRSHLAHTQSLWFQKAQKTVINFPSCLKLSGIGIGLQSLLPWPLPWSQEGTAGFPLSLRSSAPCHMQHFPYAPCLSQGSVLGKLCFGSVLLFSESSFSGQFGVTIPWGQSLFSLRN